MFAGLPAGTAVNPYATIGAIPTPAGYHRLAGGEGSFGAWLRAVPLKKGTTVYLYNGRPKENQDAQFAVLDISVGHEDLQQCADAVMRLRAQSYMPAQDVHIVKNPGGEMSPWYSADSSSGIVETPEYVFKTSELRKWAK